MDKKFKLVFGSIAIAVGVVLILIKSSSLIAVLLMLIGVIFIFNVLIKNKVLFFVLSAVLTALTIFVYINMHAFSSYERTEQQVIEINN